MPMNKTEYAKFKRCMEWYCTDPVFREKMDHSPREAIRELGYADELDFRDAYRAIRWLVFREAGSGDLNTSPYVTASYAHEQCIANHLIQIQGRKGYADEKLFAYEQRVRNRCRMENRLLRQNELIYYYPFAFELSLGCSVQCAFCGFSAQRHQGDFLYTPDNKKLFGDIVRIARQYAGPILGYCPLYFATEPMDNPDYEKFMLQFRQITGNVPQTTTALADREPERIRRWMEEIGENAVRENAAVRISLRTLSQFKKIAAEYQPEELIDVELLSNNPESIHRYSDSGRTKERADKFPGKARTRYSICCVSGMKVNLVERSVMFIEPVIPDENYPLGYRIRDCRHFDTADDFACIVRDFDAAHVHDRLPKDLPLCFNGNIRIREDAEQYVFMGDGVGYRIGRNYFTEKLMHGIGEHRSFSEITTAFPLLSEDEKRLYDAIDALFIRGYVEIC